MIVRGILIGLLIVFLLGLFVCLNKKLYCYVFEHKDWKLWNYFIKNYDKFKFEEALLFVIHDFLQDLCRNEIELIPPTYDKGKPKIGWSYKQGMTYKEMNNKVKKIWKNYV